MSSKGTLYAAFLEGAAGMEQHFHEVCHGPRFGVTDDGVGEHLPEIPFQIDAGDGLEVLVEKRQSARPCIGEVLRDRDAAHVLEYLLSLAIVVIFAASTARSHDESKTAATTSAATKDDANDKNVFVRTCVLVGWFVRSSAPQS